MIAGTNIAERGCLNSDQCRIEARISTRLVEDRFATSQIILADTLEERLPELVLCGLGAVLDFSPNYLRNTGEELVECKPS